MKSGRAVRPSAWPVAPSVEGLPCQGYGIRALQPGAPSADAVVPLGKDSLLGDSECGRPSLRPGTEPRVTKRQETLGGASRQVCAVCMLWAFVNWTVRVVRGCGGSLTADKGEHVKPRAATLLRTDRMRTHAYLQDSWWLASRPALHPSMAPRQACLSAPTPQGLPKGSALYRETEKSHCGPGGSAELELDSVGRGLGGAVGPLPRGHSWALGAGTAGTAGPRPPRG